MKNLFSLITLLEFGNKYSLTKNMLFKEASEHIYLLVENLIKDCDTDVFAADDSAMRKLDHLKVCICKGKMLNCGCEYYISDIKDLLSNQAVRDRLNSDIFYKKYGIDRNLDIHQKICKNIFNYIGGSGETFWVQADHYDGDIYDGFHENVDLERFPDYIRLTVLSEDALEYDNFIFRILSETDSVSDDLRDFIRENYRPYFIEFYIEASQLSKDQEAQLNETIFNRHRQGWFNARFISEEENLRGFPGVYAYSASPVIYKGKTLEIIDKVNDYYTSKIDISYTLPKNYLSSDESIKKKLKSIFSDVTFNKVRIYKVGNGNCVYSYGSDGKRNKRLLYDIGIDNQVAVREAVQSINYSYRSAVSSIRKFVPSCIILSHWDADHYKACVYGGQAIFDCPWIAPDLADASANAKRLGMYLYYIGKMMFVDRSMGREMNVDLTYCSKLTLYIGKNAKDLSKANCEGIAIKHENCYPCVAGGKIRCLMQGDVSYNSLPQEADFMAETPYEYLIAPHHGSKMALTDFDSVQDGTAVICCTDNRNWNKKKGTIKNRPAEKHLRWLEKRYSRVIMTEQVNRYIQFNLRLRNSVTTK